MSHTWDNLVILWWEGSKRKAFGAAPIGRVLYNMQFCLILTTTVQRHQRLHFTCVWTGLSSLPWDVAWTVNVKLGFPLRASLPPQPMCSPCAIMAQATINWPSDRPSSLSKAKVFSKWAGGEALGFFSQQRLLNLWFWGDSDPQFSMVVTGYELEGALGWAVAPAAARHMASLPWCTSQVKWGRTLWGTLSLRREPEAGLPRGQPLVTTVRDCMGRRAAGQVTCHQVTVTGKRAQAGLGGGGWDDATESRASSEGHRFKAAGEQCPAHSGSKASGLFCCPFFKYPSQRDGS